MQLKRSFLFFPVSVFLFLAFFTNSTFAQIRKGGGGRKASLYFSVGDNTAQFNTSTIHIEQPSLGNNFDLNNAKADDKNPAKSFSPSLLNYRLGYYLGYRQRYGIELNYDPVFYHLTDSQALVEKGMINDVANVNKTIYFSSKKGFVYSMKGANLLLVNFVRRFTIYRPNSNKIGIDAISKAGVGPALPYLQANFPGQNNKPGFHYDGWNTGLEEALRITLYRYIYLEFSAKYDYAFMSGLNVYEGTAKQNFGTFEAIGSLGFTIPTRKFNPLFYKGHRIITILPLSTLKDNPGKSYGESKADKKKEEEEQNSDGQMDEIPEFSEIVDKKEKKEMQDSLMRQAKEDSIYKALNPPDTSQPVEDTTEHKKHRHGLFRRHKSEDTTASQPAATDTGTTQIPAVSDSTVTKQVETKDTGTVTKDTTGTKPQIQPQDSSQSEKVEAPPKEEKADTAEMSDREKRRLEKQKEKEEREAQREAQRLQEEKDKMEQDRLDSVKNVEEMKAAEEQAKAKEEARQKEQEEKDKKEQELKDQEKKDQDMKDAEEKRKQDIKDSIEKKNQDIEDAKAKKEQEKEDLKAKREKELEDLKAQREKEAQEKKEQREKEQAELKAKREKELQDLKDKREKEQQELKEKREKEKKEREEKLQKEKEEREEKLRKEREEREKKDTTGGK